MAKKADFTSEEWQLILSMPQVASLYLALASPSNPLGLAQEMIASTKGIVEALKSSSGNELIDAVAADIREKAEKRERMEPPLKMSNDLERDEGTVPADLPRSGCAALAKGTCRCPGVQTVGVPGCPEQRQRSQGRGSLRYWRRTGE